MGIVVDHGLRPESVAEALQVQTWVTILGQYVISLLLVVQAYESKV